MSADSKGWHAVVHRDHASRPRVGLVSPPSLGWPDELWAEPPAIHVLSVEEALDLGTELIRAAGQALAKQREGGEE